MRHFETNWSTRLAYNGPDIIESNLRQTMHKNSITEFLLIQKNV